MTNLLRFFLFFVKMLVFHSFADAPLSINIKLKFQNTRRKEKEKNNSENIMLNFYNAPFDGNLHATAAKTTNTNKVTF